MKWDNDAGVWQTFQVHLVLTTGDDRKTKQCQMQNYISHTAIYSLCYPTSVKTILCLILVQSELVHKNNYSVHSWNSLMIPLKCALNQIISYPFYVSGTQILVKKCIETLWSC